MNFLLDAANAAQTSAESGWQGVILTLGTLAFFAFLSWLILR